MPVSCRKPALPVCIKLKEMSARILAISILLCTSVYSVSTKAQTPIVVQGLVLEADLVAPVPDVTVSLSTPGADASVTTTTDFRGRFVISNVPPGDYDVVLRRDGYLLKSGSRTPQRIRVSSAQQSIDLDFRMVRGAGIYGQVLKSDGQPAAGTSLEVFEIAYRNGRRILTPVAGLNSTTLRTNDRGEYRAYWLLPGEYYVRAQVRGRIAGRPTANYTAFYPDTPDATYAAQIVLRSGYEARVDFNLPPEVQDTGVTLSGRVVLETAGAPEQFSVSTMSLLPRGPNQLFANYQLPFTNVLNSNDGRFEIRGVQPGSYELFALLSTDIPGTGLFGGTPVGVNREDIKDIEVHVPANVDAIRGTISYRGEIALGFASINVDLIPDYAASGRPAIISRDGTFAAVNLAPGSYRISVAGLAPGVYIEDIFQGAASAMADGIVSVQPNAEPIRIVLNTGGGIAEGVVMSPIDRRGIADATVALVPSGPRRQNLSLYRSVIADRDGNFLLSGVAPGEYKLFAWDHIPLNAYQNAEFLAAFEGRGQTVTIMPASRVQVSLPIISQP
jgi:hypothetical protein